MSWITVGTWVAVLAVIGIVFGSIDLAARHDPAGRAATYSLTDEAVSPVVPP